MPTNFLIISFIHTYLDTVPFHEYDTSLPALIYPLIIIPHKQFILPLDNLRNSPSSADTRPCSYIPVSCCLPIPHSAFVLVIAPIRHYAFPCVKRKQVNIIIFHQHLRHNTLRLKMAYNSSGIFLSIPSQYYMAGKRNRTQHHLTAI